MTPNFPPTVAVVIPYFQREPGILRRAVDSVLRQHGAPPAHVIVVDDGSPVPADAELHVYGPDVQNRITMMRQPNRGAGSARNVGLDNLPASAEWIAFLDSDDAWNPDHLRKAIGTLELGYDLFFADHLREGEKRTHFELAGLRTAEHVAIDAEKKVFAFRGDLFTTVLTYCPIGTSTVVFRRVGNESLRFQSSYRTSEDALFWLHFANQTSRIAFGSDVQVVYGRGVNISQQPHWPSNHALEIFRDFDGMYRLIRQNFDLTQEQVAFVDRISQGNREVFALTVVAMLKARRSIDAKVFGEVLGCGPAAVAVCLRVALRESLSRMATQVSPKVTRLCRSLLDPHWG